MDNLENMQNPENIIIKSVINNIIQNIIKIHNDEINNINNRNELECPICFNEMNLKTQQIVVYDCSHKYHRICLHKWILKTSANSDCMQCNCKNYFIINKIHKNHQRNINIPSKKKKYKIRTN